MLGNGRKTIGVLVESVALDFPNQLSRGIEYKAKQLGYNVAFFSPFGNFGRKHRYHIGDDKLYDLPPYEELDGLILALDTMLEESSRERVIKMAHERCKCPIVSIRERMEGANNLLVDNHTCMEEIILHFIEDHGFKNIAFMTGPKDRWDARERLDCFLRVMAEKNLPVEDHQIFYGDFWISKGPEACDWFLSGPTRPEAIICANDFMATAVTSELIARGLRIPEDISISGYDGTREALYFSPAITTVSIPTYEMGLDAVNIIDRKQTCPTHNENIYYPGYIVPRESCGCMKSDNSEVILTRRQGHEENLKNSTRQTLMDYLSIYLGEADNLQKLSETLHYYIPNIDGYQDYALCLIEDLFEKDRTEYDDYTDTMELRIGIKYQENIGSQKIPFSRKELIPTEMSSEEPQAWYFAPIHFLNKTYGYEAFQFVDPSISGKLYLTWNIAVGNKIEDLLVGKKMTNLINELENIYNKDALTGIFNRHGLENLGRSMVDDALKKNIPLFLAILDMDGMKYINDNFGHTEGDFAIIKLSDALKNSFDQSFLLSRSGGDEFVVVGKGISKEYALSCIEKVQSNLDFFNSSNEKPYDIYVSVGFCYRVPDLDDSMETFFKESDSMMYENKRKNKLKQKRK